MLVPITNWFDDPARTVNAVGNELFGGGERVGRVSTTRAVLPGEEAPIRPGPPPSKSNAGKRDRLWNGNAF